MDQKKKWLADFKAKNHRNPTIDEVTEADKNGFVLIDDEMPVQSEEDLATATPSVTPATSWREKFKLANGRLPNLEEVKQAKATGFKSVEPLITAQTESEQNPVPRAPRQQMSKGKKIALTTGVVIIAVGVALVTWGNKHYAKSATAQRTLKILKSESASQYAKNFVWSDTKKKIDQDELAPFVNNMASSKWSNQRENDIYNQLLSGQAGNGFTFKRTGHAFLVFPKYQLTVKPVDFNVSTNNKDITLKMNGKTIGTSDSDSYSKSYKHQVSGLYKFNATGKISGQDVATSDEKEIDNNTNVNLAIDMISFDVNSNLSSGDLYIGDTKVGTLTDGLLSVKNMPVSKGAKAYVQAKFGDQTIRTTKTSLQDIYDGESINLNADGLMTEDDANSTVSSMYDALGSYASQEEDPDNLDMFKNGANNKAYQDYKKMIRHNLHDAKRNAESVSFNSPDVKSVKQTSLTTADAVYQVKTDFYYSSDDDNDSYGDLTQTFELTAHMVYDKRNETWQVDSIDPNQKKISEDNNVS